MAFRFEELPRAGFVALGGLGFGVGGEHSI
jgi:hypothetical protein